MLSPDRKEQAVVDAGEVLADRYELVEHLGGGGMAEVFRAVDRNLHRDVAVKVLSERRMPDPGMVDRFRREARNAASLNHPNVVSVHDTGQDGSGHFIVMELIDGPTLDDTIREEGPLDAERAASIAVEVCAGLSAAHANGVVHRDVKPSNIMFTGSGGVKVSDFGIARAGADATATQTGTVYGSVPFLAPETARGDDVDGRADIYGLGCVLFAMLTGAPPFQAEEPLGIIYQHLHATRPRPSSVRSGIPDDLDAIVLRCLAIDPADRYVSADELRRDLEAFLRGETPPVALAGPPLGRTQRLEPVDETVAVTPTGVSDERPGAAAGTWREPHRGPDRRGWGARRWFLIVGAIVAALVAWALLGPLLTRQPAAQRNDGATAPADPTAAETEAPPTEPTSVPPTFEVPDAPPAYEDALRDLVGLIATGASTGAIDTEAAQDLARTTRDLVGHLERGQDEPARNRIEELLSQVDRFEEEGRIEPATADALRDVIDRFVAVLGEGGGGPEGDERGGGGPGEEGPDEDGDDD